MPSVILHLYGRLAIQRGFQRVLELRIRGSAVGQRGEYVEGAGHLEGELARLTGEGVTITLPLRTEDWGERLFQVKDPNGVTVEPVDWVTQD